MEAGTRDLMLSTCTARELNFDSRSGIECELGIRNVDTANSGGLYVGRDGYDASHRARIGNELLDIRA